MPLYHLGIDDTDSLKKGCTTFIGAMLVEGLAGKCEFVDYPNLVRLNPNVPWKSRGNAAVCLRFRMESGPLEILDLATGLVEENRDTGDEKNQPGIALLEGGVPASIKDFGRRALSEVLTIEEAAGVATEAKMQYRMIHGGRGLIGAVASIGNTLERDHTFELIVYRRRELWGRKREVDPCSVEEFDRRTAPLTFNNMDYEAGKMLIAPHGPDPVLFGVRGESASVVRGALQDLKFSGAERWVIYRSNQGTGVHLAPRSIKDLRPYEAAVLSGSISKMPRAIKGGHTIAAIEDGTGEIDIAGYEPSGGFRTVVRNLLPGDKIRAYGGVRPLEDGRLTFNLERLEVLELVRKAKKNPTCPLCKRSMKSEGRGKGYGCKLCKTKAAEASWRDLERAVEMGAYMPPPRAMRHLSKPAHRYGLEKGQGEGENMKGRDAPPKPEAFYGFF